MTVNVLKLLSKLFNSRKLAKRRSRQARARLLRLEPMERRCLMAADFATISGNLFTDLTDNGSTGDDTAIVSATVRLFKDGGNGSFESSSGSAGGDDTLEDTATTDSSGNYLFPNLAAGRYFVQQAAVSGKVQRPSQALKTIDITQEQASGIGVLTIDNFTDDTLTLTANSTTPTVSNTTVTAGSNALGGERDIVLNYLSGTSNIQAQVNAGWLSVSPGPTTVGNVILTYDGVDGNASTINHTNLNINLTNSSAGAFQFLAGSEAGNSITIDVYSGSGNFSTMTQPLPETAGAAPTEVMILRFADFAVGGGSGANFAAVTALRIQVNTSAASDAQLDLTQTVAPFISQQSHANLNAMSIGDKVFNDANNNGTRDNSESGIANVLVQLFTDTNASGDFDAGDTLVSSTTTDADGTYLFENLLPGSYLAVFPQSNFDSGGALRGFIASPNPDLPNNDANNRSKAVDETTIANVGAVSIGALTLVSGGEPTNDGDSNTNSNLSFDFGFAPQVDLAILNSAHASSLHAGQNVTYTLTVTNNGPAQADNVLVVNNLPDFAIVTAQNVTATDGTVAITSNANGEVEVRYPQLAAGQSKTITVVAQIPPDEDAEPAVENVATVSGSGIDTNSNNNSATSEFDLTRSAVFQVAVTDTPDPSAVGSSLNYQIVVTNSGPSTARSLELINVLPADLNFTSVNSTVGTPVHDMGTITLDLPTLAAGGSVTINLATTIDTAFSGNSISNTVTVQSDEGALVSTTASTSINPEVDLRISQVDSSDLVSRGRQLTYTLTARNDGPSDATNVEVVNTMSADVTFVSATGPSGATVTPPSGNNRDVLISLGDLAAQTSATITVVVLVNQNAGNSISNSVTVRSSESIANQDSDTSNNSNSATTNVNSEIDLQLTKSDSATVQNPIRPGGVLTYTLTARNNGPADATGVRVVDNIPDGLQITSARIGSNSISIPSSASDTLAANPDDLVFDIGTLASGNESTITVIANVLSDLRGNLVNAATISTTSTGLVELDSNNNSTSVTTNLIAQANMGITIASTASSVVAGQSLVYHIDVTNNGVSTATNVALNHNLPAGVTFVSFIAEQGSASHANGVVTGNLGTLNPQQTVRVTVNATANPQTRGSVVSTASVTATEADADTGDNSGSATTAVTGTSNLSITTSKVNPNDPAIAGGFLSYTILVTNNGPSSAGSVQVINQLPAGLNFTQGSVQGQSTPVTANGQQVTVNLGELAPNESRTITIQANVSSTASGTLTNSSSVTATEGNPVTSSVETSVAVTGSIRGRSFVDSNRNRLNDSGDLGKSGVAIALTGADLLGRDISQSTTTDQNGDYLFQNIQPGTYTITQTQPLGFTSHISIPGTAGGTADYNAVSNIVLASGQNATGNDFGVFPNPLSLRRFLASSTDFD